MEIHGLTGSRIRERRATLGLKQLRLAEAVGISAAYLNLIEHNKRRIGGKLLTDIAAALDVDPVRLSDGADVQAVAALRSAAAAAPDAAAETENTEEFGGRFPGWARLVTAQNEKIETLERSVQELTDRMAHDPQLAASLHDVLSMAAAINSASTILSEPGELEAEWRSRFVRNIHEDSQRLAQSSQELVGFLEAGEGKDLTKASPLAALGTWLDARGHHIAELEGSFAVSIETLLDLDPDLEGAALRAAAARHLTRYRADAVALPLKDFQKAAKAGGYDPLQLAEAFDAPFDMVLRRLATLPTEPGLGAFGLVICDSSGGVLVSKSTEGLNAPLTGALCPRWPLFQALARPSNPMRAGLRMTGRDGLRFLVYAIAQPQTPARFEGPTVLQTTMLLVPAERAPIQAVHYDNVGVSCRICAHPSCDSRREASVLGSVAG